MSILTQNYFFLILFLSINNVLLGWIHPRDNHENHKSTTISNSIDFENIELEEENTEKDGTIDSDIEEKEETDEKSEEDNLENDSNKEKEDNEVNENKEQNENNNIENVKGEEKEENNEKENRGEYEEKSEKEEKQEKEDEKEKQDEKEDEKEKQDEKEDEKEKQDEKVENNTEENKDKNGTETNEEKKGENENEKNQKESTVPISPEKEKEDEESEIEIIKYDPYDPCDDIQPTNGLKEECLENPLLKGKNCCFMTIRYKYNEFNACIRVSKNRKDIKNQISEIKKKYEGSDSIDIDCYSNVIKLSFIFLSLFLVL